MRPHSSVSRVAHVRSGQFILPIVLCKNTSAAVVSEVEVMSQVQNNSMLQNVDGSVSYTRVNGVSVSAAPPPHHLILHDHSLTYMFTKRYKLS